MNDKELLRIKEQIQNAKNKMSELKGEEKALLSQLEEFDCKTLEEAVEKIESFENRIETLNTKFERLLSEFTAKYEEHGLD